MRFLVDSDGKKILKEDLFTKDAYRQKILAAIRKFKLSNYRFYQSDEEDLLQTTYCYIWQKIDKFDNKRASLNTYLYRLIQTCLLLNGYSTKKQKRSGKSQIHQLMAHYKDIWETIDNNKKFEDKLPGVTDPYAPIKFHELIDNLKKYFYEKKKHMVVKVLTLLLKFNGDKKKVSSALSLTVIRINQIIKEISHSDIYKDYIFSLNEN